MRFDPIRAGHLNWIKLLRRNPVLGACAVPESRLEHGVSHTGLGQVSFIIDNLC